MNRNDILPFYVTIWEIIGRTLGENTDTLLLYFLYLCKPPAAEGIRVTSNSHTSQRHQQASLHLCMKVHKGSKESYCALWTSCPKPLLVSTNQSHFHLIILTSLLDNTNVFQLYRQRKVHFSSILPLTTFHARGCRGGSGGGQICHDGCRFCCIIWIAVDIHKNCGPLLGPEATRQQVILDADPIAKMLAVNKIW